MPRGTLATGVFLVGAAGSAVPDGTTFSVLTSVAGDFDSKFPVTFELDSNGVFNGANQRIIYTGGESAKNSPSKSPPPSPALTCRGPSEIPERLSARPRTATM